MTRIALLLCACLAYTAIAAEPALGLSQRAGTFYKDDRPYRGVGANYFDLLIRILHQPTNTATLAGLHQLSTSGIPFVRFAVAYGEGDWRLYLTNREEFLRRFDTVVRAAEKERIGLIPSVFWHFMIFPDLFGESRDQWGNPDSATSRQMRAITADLVRRYKDSPALWAWEFGNEPNLAVDLPNAASFRKKGGSERDDLTSKLMVTMLEQFAAEVRRHDPHRAIIAGHSHPRASAWHNSAEKNWKADTREQTLEIIRRDNPASYDTIGIHVYAEKEVSREMAAWATNHLQYLSAVKALSRSMQRPLFVSEFGIAISANPAGDRQRFEQLLAAMEAAEVDVAAFWVFDLKNQDKDWNVTRDNARSYMIDLAAEANRRWNGRAARQR